VTIQVSDPGRVAGFAREGSQVAIYATSGAADQSQAIHLLLSPVRVITLGGQVPQQGTQKPSTDEAAGSVPQTLVTVELDPKDAPNVILATETSQLYLALLGPGTNVPDSAPLKLSQLFTSGGSRPTASPS